jgi:hypothetical protein
VRAVLPWGSMATRAAGSERRRLPASRRAFGGARKTARPEHGRRRSPTRRPTRSRGLRGPDQSISLGDAARGEGQRFEPKVAATTRRDSGRRTRLATRGLSP